MIVMIAMIVTIARRTVIPNTKTMTKMAILFLQKTRSGTLGCKFTHFTIEIQFGDSNIISGHASRMHSTHTL